MIEDGNSGKGKSAAPDKLSWPYNLSDEGAANPERTTIKLIRGIKETVDPTINDDYGRIAVFMSDFDSRSHLRAPIPPIQNIADRKATDEILRELDRYYHNKNRRDKEGNIINDDPRNITPIVAVNGLDEAIGVLIIRWKGNDFRVDSGNIKEKWKIEAIVKNENADSSAYIEGLVVDRGLQGKAVGTQLTLAALDIAFNRYTGYDGRSADEVRQWIFIDEQAGLFYKNMNFVRTLGFDSTGGRHGLWRELAEDMGIPNPGNRDGMEYRLTKKRWEELKKDYKMDGHPRVIISPIPIDEASLRIPNGLREQKSFINY